MMAPAHHRKRRLTFMVPAVFTPRRRRARSKQILSLRALLALRAGAGVLRGARSLALTAPRGLKYKVARGAPGDARGHR